MKIFLFLDNLSCMDFATEENKKQLNFFPSKTQFFFSIQIKNILRFCSFFFLFQKNKARALGGWAECLGEDRRITALKDSVGCHGHLVFQVRHKITVQANCRHRDFVVVVLQQSGYQLEGYSQIVSSLCLQRFQGIFTKKFSISVVWLHTDPCYPQH